MKNLAKEETAAQRLERLRAKARKLPLTPGVYIMHDKTGAIIYIGKAKALKNRVTQYFGSGSSHTEKVRQMVSRVEDFEYILCDSEFEALILECSLIKQHTPKYNILLKDDKGYHYIKVSNAVWPRITAEKQCAGDGEYIGPYHSGWIVKQTVDEAVKVFRLPQCNRSFETPSKPCLNYHIGLCNAPCAGKISHDDYLESVRSAANFIKRGGVTSGGTDELRAKMERAAENLEFELAARLRDRISAIEKISQRQKVLASTYAEQDVIAMAQSGETACFEVFLFRNSRLQDREQFLIDGVSAKPEARADFLQGYYAENREIPPRIALDGETADRELLERWLSGKAHRKVELVLPQRGEQLKLVEMCRSNAAEYLASHIQQTGRETAALDELAGLLGLTSTPSYIEAYDISNTAGSENVAAMTVFRDGKPCRAAYKKFKIKGFSGQDDYRSMAEVLDRRFEELKKGEDPWFSIKPDLILLDGGKGQLSAVLPVLARHGLEIPIFGMVKDSKHKTRAIAAEGGDIAIKSTRRAYTLIATIQEETHRCAIGYHHQRSRRKNLATGLTEIEGVGKNRASLLLRHFKTLRAIADATEKELGLVKGITKPVAAKIYAHFHSDEDNCKKEG